MALTQTTSNNKDSERKIRVERWMLVMNREQSLRQLIFKCNKELLKNEGMTWSGI